MRVDAAHSSGSSEPLTESAAAVRTQVDDRVGLIVFDNRRKHNAISVEMWASLAEVLEAWAADDDVRAVVLSGAGDKAFISGADIGQFEKNRDSADAQAEYERKIARGREALATFRKPIIARIGGYCLGAGLSVALQADIRIASDDSSFGIPAARLGIAYGFESVRRLVAAVGRAQASTLLFGAQRIGAAEALRIGLVSRVVPAADLAGAVSDLAHAISENAPLSVDGMKLIIGEACSDPSRRDMQAVADAVAACFDSEDYREGRKAFAEKRKPAFRGR